MAEAEEAEDKIRLGHRTVHRAVLDDLIRRGLRHPEFLIVDGAPRLEKRESPRYGTACRSSAARSTSTATSWRMPPSVCRRRRRESDRGLKSTTLVSGRRVPMPASSLKRFDSTRLRQFARTEAAPAHYLLIAACFAAGHADYRPVSYNRKEIPDDD